MRLYCQMTDCSMNINEECHYPTRLQIHLIKAENNTLVCEEYQKCNDEEAENKIEEGYDDQYRQNN